MRSFILSLFFISISFTQTLSIHGTVLDENNQPVEGVNITCESAGTTSDSMGKFVFDVESQQPIHFHHIAYKTVIITPETSDVVVILKSIILEGEEVFVSAMRAVEGVTPVAFSNLTQEEISSRYTVEDVPMILASEPGVFAYSESGNGTGYSYVSIRGFDQSRIAVMLDNVPLNDNESHQVYWVDHTDILKDAKDVQIQRGIGNSLYGSAAFGGSINVSTKIRSEIPVFSLNYGTGSYNTSKYSLETNSGHLLGKTLSLKARYSQVESDGYREHHGSKQKALSFGLEHRGQKMTNQFRALTGYENTHLTWDGIYTDDILDREKRRFGYKAYTDDFLQQIYSLNTRYNFHRNLTFTNTAYLVMGSGYYEVFKEGEDWYSYNLDVNDSFTDSTENDMETDLLRRKWIVNQYYGIIPTLTYRQNNFRLDIGGELRVYQGDHFGEVTNFSDESLEETLGSGWYRYYQYLGKKSSLTAFAHFAYDISEKIKVIGDIQIQNHNWSLDQEKIGHATGHQLSASWPFVNPRVGVICNPNSSMSLFVNYGKAQKEPADNQIISADDMWSEPVIAAAEVIHDMETGFDYHSKRIHFGLNLYRINYENEQLKNIDIDQEGEYDYSSADATIHQGIEFDFAWNVLNNLMIKMNGAVSQNIFESGEFKGNVLPTAPKWLFNGSIQSQHSQHFSTLLSLRHVGKQYLDAENIGEIMPFIVVDGGITYKSDHLSIGLKVNNLTDVLYSTFGYGYEWDGYNAFYWPGATRNWFVTLEYKL
ncbi:MAG: TonB-dependent receptor [Candidatus Marinimicrobia bacterium]|nr:TonB-dependent receptor [Candidatus Neomarinimicrobiota bacterium]MBL7059529.1 TonB-dependent receptor [Candidatus Neomarinimicrobiota bacterium]